MHPTLCKLGPLTLHSYGLLLALGCIAAIWRAEALHKRVGLQQGQIIDLGILLVVVGLAGARLTYVALDWRSYASAPGSIIAVWDGGLTFFGGLVAGCIAGLLWARWHSVGAAALADLLAPSIALGYGIARIGCFLNGCCYGRPTSLPWGVRFHEDGGDVLTPPSHPAQLYSTFMSFIVFWMLTRLEKRSLPAGRIFGSWLILSSIERFIMENFRRGVTAEVIWGNLTQAQLACLVLMLIGAMVIVWPRQRVSHAPVL